MECNLCLRTTIQIQELKRFVSLLPKSISALASCTTSVYVNLSKNSFFNSRFLESGCKGTTIFETNKTFPGFFSVF